LLAMAVCHSAHMLRDTPPSSERRPQQAGSYNGLCFFSRFADQWRAFSFAAVVNIHVRPMLDCRCRANVCVTGVFDMPSANAPLQAL